MPEAKFQIKRKCEVCGNTFIAKTLDSRYCCRHCTDIAYKNRKAAKAKEEQLNQIAQLIPGEREFISVKEAVLAISISIFTSKISLVWNLKLRQKLEMIQHKLGLPIVQLFSSGSLIPPKVHFWGRDDWKTSKLITLKTLINTFFISFMLFYLFMSIIFI